MSQFGALLGMCLVITYLRRLNYIRERSNRRTRTKLEISYLASVAYRWLQKHEHVIATVDKSNNFNPGQRLQFGFEVELTGIGRCIWYCIHSTFTWFLSWLQMQKSEVLRLMNVYDLLIQSSRNYYEPCIDYANLFKKLQLYPRDNSQTEIIELTFNDTCVYYIGLVFTNVANSISLWSTIYELDKSRMTMSP